MEAFLEALVYRKFSALQVKEKFKNKCNVNFSLLLVNFTVTLKILQE